MKRLWISLLFLTGVALAASWIADHPGSAIIHWSGYRIDTSFAFIFFIALFAAWGFAWIYTLARGVAQMPQRFARARQIRHFERGLRELTSSVAALAAADYALAEAHAHKAHKYLGSTPMGLLVSAQIAKGRGDENMTRELLTQLQEHPETQKAATRLLSGDKPKSKEYIWGKKFKSFIRKG